MQNLYGGADLSPYTKIALQMMMISVVQNQIQLLTTLQGAIFLT